jgi:hypothetical protein
VSVGRRGMAATPMAQPLDPARAVRVSATAAMWYKIRSNGSNRADDSVFSRNCRRDVSSRPQSATCPRHICWI